MAWLVFISWIFLYANELEDYSTYFGKGGSDFLDLGHHPLLGLLTVITLADSGSRSSLVCHLGPI